MTRPRITTVVGARPQFVKLAPVSRHLREVADERLIHTGQHYDYEMSRLFFEELDIPEPDSHLDVGSGSHAAQLGRTMIAIENDLVANPPELVVLFGDTNSTLGAALAASKLCVPIAHIEAGVRGFNRQEPEEVNRVLTDRLSELLFVPTQIAVKNLADEGIASGVHNVGDVMTDVLFDTRREHGQGEDRVRTLGVEPGAYTLVTFHRPANVDTDGPLTEIVEALLALDDIVVWPVHPRTRKRLRETGLIERLEASDQIHLIDPVGYLTNMALLGNASRTITDSGGLQKEAYLLRVPCVTVSEQTAWVETVDSGWNRLVRSERGAIVQTASEFRGGTSHPDVYGDGTASAQIAAIIAARFAASTAARSAASNADRS